MGAAASCVQSCAVSVFADEESLCSYVSESVSDLGCDSQRSPPRSPPVLCVAHQGSRARALPCASREATIAQQTCVMCLRAGRWVRSKRAHAHTQASRDGAPAHSARDLTLACELETVPDIMTPPLILHSIPVVHMLQEVLAAARSRTLTALCGFNTSSSKSHRDPAHAQKAL